MKVKKLIIKKIKDISHSLGVELSKYETEVNRSRNSGFNKWETLSEFLIIHLNRQREGLASNKEDEFLKFITDNYRNSKSQLFQDLLVLFLLGKKESGYFVEFGATNGISFSNTYLLENGFNWSGILAEPGKTWHKDLTSIRKCMIDKRCVWESSKKVLVFNETESAELSTVNDLSGKDSLATTRVGNKKYSVETVSLNDLLQQNSAPTNIDFMSVDTEGSELLILSHFDFNKYNISVICVEHNFCEPDRSDINSLLLKNGFERIFAEYSHFDDWYINCKLSLL